MRPVLAIAVITIRSAIRSRIMLCLIALLVAIVAGLPLTVKGDGTAAGYAQIVIGYTLGLSGVLLAMATLWGGCAAISSEIADKQIQMLVSKPVGRGQIWLGKWAGLMAMNALLLGIAVGSTQVLLKWSPGGAGLSPEERGKLFHSVLVARREVRPVLPDVEGPAAARFAELEKAGKIPADADPDDAMDMVRRSLRVEAGAIGPGQGRTWQIEMPEPPAPGSSLTLRFKFSAATLGSNPMRGVWIVGPPSDPSSYRAAVTNAPAAYGELAIPGDAVKSATTLTLSYANIDDTGTTVFFEADDCIAVMLPAGGFGGNLVRGALVVLAQLAFLAALGVTAGTLFSLPVAAFMSIFVMMLLLSAGFIQDMSTKRSFFGRPQQASTAQKAANAGLRGLYGAMAILTRPMDFDAPWSDIATGRLVNWQRVGKSGAVNVVLYGGLVALLGIYVFNRREVALPSS